MRAMLSICEEMSFLMLCFICIIPTGSISTNHIHHSALSRGGNSFSTNEVIDSHKQPYYLKVPTTVQTYEDADVILSCRIENLHDRMVFWIRNADLQILTAGLMTFSTDPRFRVNHENSVDEKDWSLLIRNVRIGDSGVYECQINTDPKMKLNIHLVVKEFTEMMEMDSPFHQQSGASIDGNNLNVLKRGQTVTFTCRITEIDVSSGNSKSIEWLKDGKLVSLQIRNGGTVTSVTTIWLEKSGVSKLTLSQLENDDEGNYSCRSNGFESDAVTLRVVWEVADEASGNCGAINRKHYSSLVSIILVLIISVITAL